MNVEDPTATKLSLVVLLWCTFPDVYSVKEMQLLLCSQQGKGKENTGLTDDILVMIIVQPVTCKNIDIISQVDSILL